MQSRGRQSLARRLVPAILGIGCAAGSLFGLLNGYYLLAFSQASFAAAMILVLLGSETRGTVYRYLTWIFLSTGILVTVVAALT